MTSTSRRKARAGFFGSATTAVSSGPLTTSTATMMKKRFRPPAIVA
jgi:hypothetical protein